MFLICCVAMLVLCLVALIVFMLPLSSNVSQLSCLRLFRVVLCCVSLVHPVFRCLSSFCQPCCLKLFSVVSVCMMLPTVVKVSFALQVVLVLFRKVVQDCFN